MKTARTKERKEEQVASEGNDDPFLRHQRLNHDEIGT
jgi:hypothetical protein